MPFFSRYHVRRGDRTDRYRPTYRVENSSRTPHNSAPELQMSKDVFEMLLQFQQAQNDAPNRAFDALLRHQNDLIRTITRPNGYQRAPDQSARRYVPGMNHTAQSPPRAPRGRRGRAQLPLSARLNPPDTSTPTAVEAHVPNNSNTPTAQRGRRHTRAERRVKGDGTVRNTRVQELDKELDDLREDRVRDFLGLQSTRATTSMAGSSGDVPMNVDLTPSWGEPMGPAISRA